MRSAIPQNLHVDSGRPGLFVVQRDWAIDNGNAAALTEATRAAELWNRPPEEWELERVETGYPWTRITVAQMAAGDVVYIDSERIDLRVAFRTGPWEQAERYFRERGIEMRQRWGENAVEVRPMPFRIRMIEYPRRARVPTILDANNIVV